MIELIGETVATWVALMIFVLPVAVAIAALSGDRDDVLMGGALWLTIIAAITVESLWPTWHLLLVCLIAIGFVGSVYFLVRQGFKLASLAGKLRVAVMNRAG